MMNNELFFSYLEESDKEFTAVESAFDLEMARADLAYEYADKLYDIKLKQAEYKVLTESGTFEDLDVMYEEAAAAVAEKKGNVVSTIFKKISDFISSIFEAIANLFGKKQQEDFNKAVQAGEITTVEVEQDPVKAANAFEAAWKQLKAFATPGFTKDNGNGEKVFSIAKTLKTTVMALGAGAIAAKVVPGAYNKLKKNLGEVKDASDKLAKDNSGDPEAKKTLGSALREMVSTGTASLKNIGKSAAKAIGKKGGDIAATVGTGASAVAGKVGGKANQIKNKIASLEADGKNRSEIIASLVGTGMSKAEASEYADEFMGGAPGKVAKAAGAALSGVTGAVSTAKSAGGAVKSRISKMVKDGYDRKDIIDSLVNSGMSKAEARSYAAEFMGESAFDDMDEMDYMEASDYKEACEDILSILDEMI